jgi:hypothetical protein
LAHKEPLELEQLDLPECKVLPVQLAQQESEPLAQLVFRERLVQLAFRERLARPENKVLPELKVLLVYKAIKEQPENKVLPEPLAHKVFKEQQVQPEYKVPPALPERLDWAQLAQLEPPALPERLALKVLLVYKAIREPLVHKVLLALAQPAPQELQD